MRSLKLSVTYLPSLDSRYPLWPKEHSLSTIFSWCGLCEPHTIPLVHIPTRQHSSSCPWQCLASLDVSRIHHTPQTARHPSLWELRAQSNQVPKHVRPSRLATESSETSPESLISASKWQPTGTTTRLRPRCPPFLVPILSATIWVVLHR